jgi:hypothetical protein
MNFPVRIKIFDRISVFLNPDCLQFGFFVVIRNLKVSLMMSGTDSHSGNASDISLLITVYTIYRIANSLVF